jgi:hypothetical protein
MKIKPEVGSKQRLFEMMNRVNKINLNEGVTPDQVVISAFDKLKNGSLEEVNGGKNEVTVQTNDNTTIVLIIGSDKENNQYKFEFVTNFNEGQEDGTYNIDSTKLKTFSFNTANGSMGYDLDENALQNFNRQYSDHMFEVVNKYFEIEDTTPSLDQPEEVDENEIMDQSNPYGGGKDDIQKSKNYGDNEPVNPALRVKSKSLERFVESKDSSGVATGILKNLIGKKPETKSDSVSYEPDSDEDKLLRKRAYSNIRKEKKDEKYVPSKEEIKKEIEKIKKSSTLTKKKKKVVNEELGVASSILNKSIGEPKPTGELSTKSPIDDLPAEKKKIIHQAIDNLTIKRGRREYAPSAQEINAEIQKMMGKGDEKVWENDELTPEENPELTDAPHSSGAYTQDGMAGERDRNDNPIPAIEPNWSKMSDDTKEVGQEDLEGAIEKREEMGDQLSGGLGDDANPDDLDSEQLLRGLEVEMEHTDDPMIALEITLDHLMEDPKYYGEGDENAEEMAMKGAQSDIDDYDPTNPDKEMGSPAEAYKKWTQKSGDEELTDELLGYKPHNVGDYVKEYTERDLIGDKEISNLMKNWRNLQPIQRQKAFDEFKKDLTTNKNNNNY